MLAVDDDGDGDSMGEKVVLGIAVSEQTQQEYSNQSELPNSRINYGQSRLTKAT